MPPLAELTNTSDARYRVPVGLIDEEVECAAQGTHAERGTVTYGGFVVHSRLFGAERGQREIRNEEVECDAQGTRAERGIVTSGGFVVHFRLFAAARRLREIRKLPANWDSYGSPPLNQGVFDSAKEFLFSLHRDAPSPTVVPVSGGGVQFEWQINGRELEIEFCPDGRIEYLKVSEDETMDEGEIPPTKAMRSHALLTWLLEGQQTWETS